MTAIAYSNLCVPTFPGYCRGLTAGEEGAGERRVRAETEESREQALGYGGSPGYQPEICNS